MKRILSLIFLVALVSVSWADTGMQSPVAQTTIDTFRVAAIQGIGRAAGPTGKDVIVYVIEWGYVSGAFVSIGKSRVVITNDAVTVTDFDDSPINAARVITDFSGFPAAYQSSPASEVLNQLNTGNFGGQGTMMAYFEAITNQLFGF